MHVQQIRRMWEGGPLRRWSETRHGGNCLASDRGGFTGAYVCDECRPAMRWRLSRQARAEVALRGM